MKELTLIDRDQSFMKSLLENDGNCITDSNSIKKAKII